MIELTTNEDIEDFINLKLDTLKGTQFYNFFSERKNQFKELLFVFDNIIFYSEEEISFENVPNNKSYCPLISFRIRESSVHVNGLWSRYGDENAENLTIDQSINYIINNKTKFIQR